MSQIVLDGAYLHTTPGIYAFLGLATLPRFRTQANLLRLIPREIIDRIARFAHRESYLAAWRTSDPDVLSTRTDIARLTEFDDVMRLARPLRTGVTYVEVTTSMGWYGTRLSFLGKRSVFMNREIANDFVIELDNEEDHDVQGRDVRDICFLRMNGRYFLIKSLSDSIWSWCEEVVFGALVDTVRGCVTFRLNGVDGPCLFLGADWWGAEGVRIELSDFPGPDSQENGGPLPLIVACATPAVPPSLLEAAANPRHAWEHIAAGEFVDVSYAYP